MQSVFLDTHLWKAVELGTGTCTDLYYHLKDMLSANVLSAKYITSVHVSKRHARQ